MYTDQRGFHAPVQCYDFVLLEARAPKIFR